MAYGRDRVYLAVNWHVLRAIKFAQSIPKVGTWVIKEVNVPAINRCYFEGKHFVQASLNFLWEEHH